MDLIHSKNVSWTYIFHVKANVMAGGNNLHLNEVRSGLTVIKDWLARIYRPGMSARGFIDNFVEYIGDKNAAIGAVVISLLISLWIFSLFAFFSSIIISIISTIVIFVIAKLIFYKPKEIFVEIDGENTVLSYVKDIHVTGESEIVVHSQPGYGKDKNTYIELQLYDSISILNCRNITSIVDKSYNDIEIKFFHPIAGNYTVSATSKEGAVEYKVIMQSADNCRINFLNPIRKNVRLDFKTA